MSGCFPACALASRIEATLCFRMRMQAVTGLALSILGVDKGTVLFSTAGSMLQGVVALAFTT
jgi:hypothetical protein